MFAWTKRWPRVAIGCLLFTLTLLSWSSWQIVRLINADINPSVDNIAKLNQLVAESQPAGDNAWDVYRDILTTNIGITTQGPMGARWRSFDTFTNTSTLIQGAWSDINRTQAIAQLETFRDLLDKLDLAAGMPAFFKPVPHSGNALTGEQEPNRLAPIIFVLLPELGGLKRLGKLNSNAMRVAAESGDWNEVVRRIKSSLAIGNGLTNHMVIDTLYGISIIALSTQELARLLDEFDIPVQTVQSLLSEIESLRFSARAVNHHWLEGEALMAEDSIQWMFTDDGHGNGAFLPARASRIMHASFTSPLTLGERLLNLPGLLEVDRKTTTEATRRHFAELHNLIDAPPLQRPALYTALIKTLYTPQLKVMNVVIGAYSRGMRQPELLEENLAALRVMLLLEIHHAQTGVWPASLAEALSEQDRRDPVMGEPFIYQLTPDDPDGRAYELRLPIEDRYKRQAVVNPPREPLLVDEIGDESVEPVDPPTP